MDKRSFRPPSTIGAASLLTVFAVLCLVIFALLALSTVAANERLSEASRASVEAYYEADCRAEEILAALRGGEMPEGVTLSGDTYSYICPISDTQALAVTVRGEREQFEILRWQAVSTVDWTGDDSLPVWDGEGKG